MNDFIRVDLVDVAEPSATIAFGHHTAPNDNRSFWLHSKACPQAQRSQQQETSAICCCGGFDTVTLHIPADGLIDAGQLQAMHLQLSRIAVHRRASSRQHWRGGLSRRNERDAKAMLANASAQPQLLGEIAQHCKLSRSHFSKAFKQSTGVSPHAWQLQHRLRRVRQLLADASLTIASIADRCGFADQSHLTRLFKLHVGTTPAQWRRQQHG
jgi:AraC-like DNA-binding protein